MKYRGVVQFTKEEAIAFAEGGEWKDWTPEEIGKFCMYQKLLCVPFDVFHEGVEAALGRPVWTHEFVYWDSLIDELEGKIGKSTIADVMKKLDVLAGDKPIIVIET